MNGEEERLIGLERFTRKACFQQLASFPKGVGTHLLGIFQGADFQHERKRALLVPGPGDGTLHDYWGRVKADQIKRFIAI